MNQQWIELAYVAAAVLFIFALKAMSSPRTARRGNLIGALGMLIAIVSTLLSRGVVSWHWIVIGLVLGSAIGAYLATTVKMTGMPQMVAMFNGMGGLASGLVVLVVAFSSWRMASYTAFTVGVSTLIGWVTLTGSLVAFAKLQGFVLSGKPLLFPMQKLANLGLLLGCVGLIALWTCLPTWWWLVIPLLLMACALGIGFTIPIGGGDMPVVISLLNSYSGLAACATGFVLGNSGLIIAGALVGASGIILTRIMCAAMNRSLLNVLFAGVGVVTPAGEDQAERKPVTSWTAQDAAICLENSSRVVIVPGYGMAVAQAQHALRELADVLVESGIDVTYGIHEVAGRMPGHMNVLLAEADVPYEQLLDRQSVNSEFDHTDAVLVIGANDVVNPAARSDKTSPIYGMPILDVDKAGTVMVCKRTLNPGFAGIDNELFYQDNTAMIFGDAKKTVTEIIAALKE
ncbi:MAG: NAD(P)(+) transhydrogenase (Re/Si-specific) subunit beta [Phycisphaerae bacterium]|jgi:NAD(P) transhydrogenase subunit beta|nr:NAD(P)(+) transhydrogenase (Re/Si-specific) subunit beta [Phycisphaerae bacterium]